MAERSNRLAHETSPYLLEHASNPVDWYAWGAEALERAEREDKPILLSIGYSACHWCHVMARESFEDAEIARLMNDNFVCIKVDREERPDLDELYMTATIALSGSGGWPMTVFLTPSREPFFAGTYFPPRDAAGRPGMTTVLDRVAQLWRDERSTLFEQARELTEHLKKQAELPQAAGVSAEALRVAARQLAREFDPVFGGFGRAPKFPPSSALSLLLRHARRSGDNQALTMVNHTLAAMAAGGIYDQLAGGFARYSVDAGWAVPHFEKMLYDNAQLVEVFLEAYQEGGHDTFRRVARETLDYLISEMQAPSGGFFSSSDADSEGEEGKYFVFSADELRRVLGQPLAARFAAYYGVSEAGNFEGKNVLTLSRSLDQVATEIGVAAAELADDIERGRALLLEYRRSRVAPAVDDKILSSWNGLTIRALAEGARVLGDVRYLEAAERAARHLLDVMRGADGRLLRVARAGQARLGGYLEDYAFVADGLLSLYEAGGHDDFFRSSVELCERMLLDFEAEDGGALHHTSRDHEALLARPREGNDGALPSANAVAARILARLAAHGVQTERYRARASRIVRAFGVPLKRAPRAFATMLGVVDFLLGPTLEVAIAHGDEDEAGRLVGELSHRYLPNRVLAHAEAGVSVSPLAQEKTALEGHTTVYVCESFVCRAPTREPSALAQLVEEYVERSRSEGLGELGGARLDGRASPEGTARWFTRGPGTADASPHATRTKFEGLTLSKLALGSYRVGLDHPAHREAVELCLRQGANLVDTSPSFARGDSERLIGEVLADFARNGGPERDEFMIISKVGVALGADAERLARRSEGAERPRFTVPLRAEQPLTQGAFSLDDEFLESQLLGSLERLGIEHLDVCLLQSPEYLLIAGFERADYERALLSAFAFLERQVEMGRIGRYGLVTNTATLFGEAEQVDVLRAVELARQVQGAQHHFRVVELPINLAERAALEPAERAALEGSAEQTWLELVRGSGLLTLACRPLSTFAPGALLRLVDPPAARPASPLAEARYRLASLEAEFETRFGPALRLAGLVGPEALLDLSSKLGPVLERTVTLEQFDQAEATMVTPRLRGTLAELDRAHSGDERASWSEFRGNYVRAVAAYLEAVRAQAGERSAASLENLGTSVMGDELAPAKVRAWLAEAADAPWLDKALGALFRAPGLDAVAVGLRTPKQVDAALGVLRRLR